MTYKAHFKAVLIKESEDAVDKVKTSLSQAEEAIEKVKTGLCRAEAYLNTLKSLPIGDLLDLQRKLQEAEAKAATLKAERDHWAAEAARLKAREPLVANNDNNEPEGALLIKNLRLQKELQDAQSELEKLQAPAEGQPHQSDLDWVADNARLTYKTSQIRRELARLKASREPNKPKHPAVANGILEAQLLDLQEAERKLAQAKAAAAADAQAKAAAAADAQAKAAAADEPEQGKPADAQAKPEPEQGKPADAQAKPAAEPEQGWVNVFAPERMTDLKWITDNARLSHDTIQVQRELAKLQAEQGWVAKNRNLADGILEAQRLALDKAKRELDVVKARPAIGCLFERLALEKAKRELDAENARLLHLVTADADQQARHLSSHAHLEAQRLGLPAAQHAPPTPPPDASVGLAVRNARLQDELCQALVEAAAAGKP